jgi:hypothetical protein
MTMRRKNPKLSKRTRKAIKVVKKLRKAGFIATSGYSLDLPFSKRLSASGTIDYASTTEMA